MFVLCWLLLVHSTLNTIVNTLTVRSVTWHLCYAIENPGQEYINIDKKGWHAVPHGLIQKE
jgi:hypothetical protein